MLLRQVDGLFLVPQLHGQRASARRDREIAITESPHQVEGLPRRLLLCQPQRIRRHVLFDCGAHLGRRAEEAVRGHQPAEGLVRALEVVGLHEEPYAPDAIVEVREDRPRQELVPHRLPEALDLSAGLRVMRAALDVPDSMAAKLLLERRFAAPRRVLASLVGQDFTRCAVVGNRTSQSFHDERRPLVVRHHEAHEVARVVVQEGRHVDPLLPAQQEREEIRLPELIGLRTLEASLGRPRLGFRRRRFLEEPLLVKDAAHRRFRNPERFEPLQHVPDSSRAPVRVFALRGDNGIAPSSTLRPWRHLGHSRHGDQRVYPTQPVPSRPLRCRCRRNAEHAADLVERPALVNDRPCDADPQLDRPGPSCSRARAVL